MKIAGKRVGPTEMESIAAEVDGVVAAAAVGVPHPTKGQVPASSWSWRPARKGDESLPDEVADHVARSFGKPLRPEAVLVVDTMPLTRSGKIHRRVLRGWVSGQDPGDLSTLENPEIEAAVRLAASAPLRAAPRARRLTFCQGQRLGPGECLVQGAVDGVVALRTVVVISRPAIRLRLRRRPGQAAGPCRLSFLVTAN